MKARKAPERDDVPSTASAWAEQYSRHPDDDSLRGNGFAILLRPRSGPAIWHRDGRWYRGGQTYTTEEAMRLVDHEIQRDIDELCTGETTCKDRESRVRR